MSEHRLLPWTPRYWWETLRAPNAPLIGRGTAQEKDQPWRSAKYVNVRIPRSQAVIVFGSWGLPHPTEVDDDGSEYLELRTLDWDEVFGAEGDGEDGTPD